MRARAVRARVCVCARVHVCVCVCVCVSRDSESAAGFLHSILRIPQHDAWELYAVCARDRHAGAGSQGAVARHRCPAAVWSAGALSLPLALPRSLSPPLSLSLMRSVGVELRCSGFQQRGCALRNTRKVSLPRVNSNSSIILLHSFESN